jgi:hypothetical protein
LVHNRTRRRRRTTQEIPFYSSHSHKRISTPFFSSSSSSSCLFLPFQPTRSKKLDEKNQGERERDFFSTTGVTVAAIIIIIMAVVRLEDFSFSLFLVCLLLRKENVSNSLITKKKKHSQL